MLRQVLAALLCGLAGIASAQPYPNRPITLVVPFAPGGTNDILARIVGDGLTKKLGQSVLIDNRGGAGGNIGAAVVAQAKADGYTLLMGYNGTNAINPSLYKRVSWDPVKSFDPVSMVARVNNVVVVHPSIPAKTLPELVAYAKANSGSVNYGSAGAGSIFHLAGEMLAHQAGIRLTHVPYKGAAPALTDLIAGQVQMMISTIPTALPHIKAGKLRVIAVTGAERSPLFPSIPTARESGYPDLVVDSWYAVFAPKGLPQDVQATLGTAMRDILADPAVRQRMEEQGANPRSSTGAELGQLLAADMKSWKDLIERIQLSLD